jgi:hypothetical protein
MGAEAPRPTVEVAVVAAVIGVVVGTLELFLLAVRVGIAGNVELRQDLARLRSKRLKGESEILCRLDDARVFARGPDVGGH